MTPTENIAKLHKLQGIVKSLENERDELVLHVEQLGTRQLAIEEASVLIQDTAQESQEKVKLQLSSLVSKAVQTIYPEEDYSFSLNFASERGQTSVYPTLILNGNELDPMDNSGGMAEVISFALRVALIAIGKKDKVLILDEPFTGVSASRIPLVHAFLEQMSADFGLQMLITTHLSGLTEDVEKAFTVIKDGECSVVRV